MNTKREVWDQEDLSTCGVCGKSEPRNVDEETECEREAHVARLLEEFPNWEGYNGTY